MITHKFPLKLVAPKFWFGVVLGLGLLMPFAPGCDFAGGGGKDGTGADGAGGAAAAQGGSNEVPPAGGGGAIGVDAGGTSMAGGAAVPPGGAGGGVQTGGTGGMVSGGAGGGLSVGGSGGEAAAPYPAGPYGFKVNDTVGNFTFTTAQGQMVSMAHLRARPGVTVILWSSGAEWCTICKIQAPKLSNLATTRKAQGLLVFETLHQNTQGGAADAATLKRWQDALQGSHELFIEKNPNYAGHNDNPLELIIDAKTMKIRFRQVHTSSDLTVHVDAALKAAGT